MRLTKKQIMSRYAFDLCICCGKDDIEAKGNLLCKKCNEEYWKALRNSMYIGTNEQYKACMLFYKLFPDERTSTTVFPDVNRANAIHHYFQMKKIISRRP